MPAYNFQARFAGLVESGQKRQTIRATGKRHHAQPGDSLQLYTGMRTRHCRKLLTPDPVCVSVDRCMLDVHDDTGETVVSINGLSIDDYEAFAQADGFSTFKDMDDFFLKHHSFPFEGLLIKW